MVLEKYLVDLSPKHMDYFGEALNEECDDFVWYLAENKIGLMRKHSPSAVAFYDNLLKVEEESLILTQDNETLKIQRVLNSPGVLIANSLESSKRLNSLIELLKKDQTHLFYSLSKEGTQYGDLILTFSQTPPQKEFYQKQTPIEIIIN